jgi:hypothetical protein
MLGFGEKYTREKFDEAKKDADSKDDAYIYAGSLAGGGGGNGFTSGEKQKMYDELSENATEAHKRVQELYGKSEKEAHAMNEEYDHLVKRAQEAQWDVKMFEREKLGMHPFVSKEEK